MMRRIFSTLIAAFLFVIPAFAADINVVTSGAFTAAYLELVPIYEHETHNKVITGFGPSMGTTVNAIPVRLARGESIDVVIMASPGLDPLMKEGKIHKDSRVDLVRSLIGMAVKTGAPHPDISTVDALKRTLLSAKSIAYSDSASGVYLQDVLFPKLGVWDQIKSKSKQIPADPVGGVVAAGQAEIGFQQISELRPVKGIDIVGELPPGAAIETIFVAAIPMTSKQPEAAKALIQWMARPANYPLIKKTGLEPVTTQPATSPGQTTVLQPPPARGGTPQTDKVPPANSGADPYTVVRDWARIDGRPWGGSNGVAIDRDGKTVWATDRCVANPTPGCVGSKFNPIHHFDESGKEISSFGAGMFAWPHGIHIDKDGNIWVTDARTTTADELKKFPGEKPKGSIVVKFSPEGKVLMTIGKPGVNGNPPEALTDPTVVLTDPANGDVYIAESHTDVRDPHLVGRISVFDKNGKFLRTLGKTGTGPGEFRTPHALAWDSKGNLIVADRHNHRVQILTKDGKFIRELDNFGRTSGLIIDKNEVIYTTDSESTEKVHPGWLRGIRIGSLKDGKVTVFVPAHKADGLPEGAMGEGIAMDAAGNIYTAEATLLGVTKYTKK
jgi:molybdate transport system substrate-binding protein